MRTVARILAPVLALVIVLAPACELPSTRVPIATAVVPVETTADLQAAIDTMRARGCVLRIVEASPTEAAAWAVFECLTLPAQPAG
jgi:hypothetical protein